MQLACAHHQRELREAGEALADSQRKLDRLLDQLGEYQAAERAESGGCAIVLALALGLFVWVCLVSAAASGLGSCIEEGRSVGLRGGKQGGAACAERLLCRLR